MQNPTSSTSKWKAFFKKKKKSIQINQVLINQINSNTQTQNQIEIKQSSEQINKISQIKQNNQETTIQNYKQNENNLTSQIDKIKQNNQETNSDTKSQQHKKKQQNQQQSIISKNQISTSTKKILSILQLKQQSKPKVSSKQQEKSNQKQQQKFNQTITNSINQEQKAQKNKSKIVRGHYKIFNPQHFDIKTNQIKTSIHRWQFGSGKTPNEILISSWNINGIRARMANNDILPYLEYQKPDIFCVNEHKMDQKSYLQSPYKFWGYYSYWNFPKYSLGYSGVAIFSRYPAIQMYEDIHIPEHSKQGRVITLVFDKFILINIYVPTCGRELQRLKYRVQEFDPAFREYIVKLKQKFTSKMIIICGDLNVAHDILDCHTGKRMKQGKDPAFTLQQRNSFSTLLKEANLIDTFRHFHPQTRQYTWWNMRRGGRQRAGQTGIGKRLDYFLVDKESFSYVKSSQILKRIKGCDHCPIQLKLDFK